MKLPRSIIKRYGITKKAWAVFRGTKHKGGNRMAKRHRTSHKGGFKGLLGGNKLMEGFFKIPVADNAAKGVGYATILRKFINIHPLQDEGIAFATSGIVGAGAIFALKNFATNTTTTANAGGLFNY